MSIRRRTAAIVTAAVLIVSGLVGSAASATVDDELPVFTSEGPIVDRLNDDTWNPTKEYIFPAVFHAGEHLEDPLGEWYVYYAPHDSPAGINVMYSDSLNGPWTQYEGNPIIENTWDDHYSVSHISAPDVIWNDEAGEIFLYFHGENTTDRYATSSDGFSFEYGGEVMSTTQFGRNATETSYNRVFENPFPENGWEYAMFFMVNDTSNIRRIALAYSHDGVEWEAQPGWVIDPGAAEGTNVSAADLWEWNGTQYVVYGSSVGTIFARELNETLHPIGDALPLYIPTPVPPEDGRATSPQIITADGETHMIFEIGGRSRTTIAHAVLDPDGWRDPINTNPSDPLYEQCFGAGSDEFDGEALSDEWSILRDQDGRQRLENGALVMSSPPVSVPDATLPQKPVPAGAWEVTTEVSYNPTEKYQQAGMMLHRDDRNNAKAVWGYANGGVRFDFIWKENGVDRFDSWTWEDTVFPPADMGDTAWLRMTSDGEWITAAVSTDGETFITLGRPIPVEKLGATAIGPMAYRGVAAAADIEASFEWMRFSPTSEEQQDCTTVPIEDAETAVPAAGVLSSTSGWAHGLHDGNFDVQWNMWWGANASRVNVYQDDILIHTEELAAAGPAAQQVKVAVSGLANGTYEFTAELINSQGTSAPKPLVVEVTDAAPAAPVLFSDNWDSDGDYLITADLWWGTNASEWTLLENGAEVESGALSAATPAAQHVEFAITDRTAGSWTYVLEFANEAGITESKPLEVVVR